MPMETEPHAKSKAFDLFWPLLGTLLRNWHLFQAKTSGLVPRVNMADEQSMKIKGIASFATSSLQPTVWRLQLLWEQSSFSTARMPWIRGIYPRLLQVLVKHFLSSFQGELNLYPGGLICHWTKLVFFFPTTKTYSLTSEICNCCTYICTNIPATD